MKFSLDCMYCWLAKVRWEVYWSKFETGSPRRKALEEGWRLRLRELGSGTVISIIIAGLF